MFKVFIEQPDKLTENMFEERGWELVYNMEEADLVCFVGGEDVSPALYHEKNTHSYCSPDLDLHSIRVYMDAKELNLPCIGICRGGQFLNVMNGGKMVQDIEGHGIAGTHLVNLSTNVLSTSDEVDKFHSVSFEATSTHHQEIVPNKNADILLTGESEDKVTEVLVYYEDGDYDICFQPHPEYDNGVACREVFFNIINEYIL